TPHLKSREVFIHKWCKFFRNESHKVCRLITFWMEIMITPLYCRVWNTYDDCAFNFIFFVKSFINSIDLSILKEVLRIECENNVVLVKSCINFRYIILNCDFLTEDFGVDCTFMNTFCFIHQESPLNSHYIYLLYL